MPWADRTGFGAWRFPVGRSRAEIANTDKATTARIRRTQQATYKQIQSPIQFGFVNNRSFNAFATLFARLTIFTSAAVGKCNVIASVVLLNQVVVYRGFGAAAALPFTSATTPAVKRASGTFCTTI
jgi:hypothetical protein